MNFLAHYVVATKYGTTTRPISCYIVGNALPDLLPLASARLRTGHFCAAPHPTPEIRAVEHGAAIHLSTDSAFHKLDRFAKVQAEIGELLAQTDFQGIRVRRFFLAHILAELALDATIVRRDAQIVERFYAAFDTAEFDAAVQWAEIVLQREIPLLDSVLRRFGRSRYLESYTDNTGVAEGLNQLSMRARQDRFAGENMARLTQLVERAIATIAPHVDHLLSETAKSVYQDYPDTVSK